MNSFLLKSKEALLAELNADNTTSFTIDDIDFSIPKVINGTWREEVVNGNTAIRLTGKGEFGGQKIVTYTRRDLSNLQHLPWLKVGPGRATSTHGLLKGLRAFTGLDFTSDDLEDLPLVVDNGQISAVLTAKPGSVGWVGSVQIPLGEGGYLVEDEAQVTDLEGLNYPTPNDEDTYALVYLYGYNFTGIVDTLSDIEAGVALTTEQLDILTQEIRRLDVGNGKLLWNTDPEEVQWSLAGLTVLFNGLNADPTKPTNPEYKYVMQVKLRDEVTLPSGEFFLHYNDPYNPDDF